MTSDSQLPESQREAIRSLLVSTAILGESRPRRLGVKTVIAGLLAFIVAGAATGGAVAAWSSSQSARGKAASPSPAPSSLLLGGFRTFGKPLVVVGTTSRTIQLPNVPAGARAVSIALTCLGAGTFSITNGTKAGSLSLDCATGRGPQGDVLSIPVDAIGSGELSVTTSSDAKYTITAVYGN